MEKLTFKQYLASKEQLREAIKRTPIQSIEYIIKRYCKLTIGESKDARDHVSLKPKQKIIVEWRYDNIKEIPTPMNVTFVGVGTVMEGQEYKVLWNGERLQNWLTKNTTERSII